MGRIKRGSERRDGLPPAVSVVGTFWNNCSE